MKSIQGHMCSHEEIYPAENEILPLSETKESVTSVVEGNGKIGETVQFLPKAVEESKSSGQVPLSVYWAYFRSGSNPCVLIFLLTTSIITQILFTGCDYWLNIWTKAEESGRLYIETSVVEPAELDDGNLTTPSANGSSAGEVILVEWDRENYVLIYTVIVTVFSIFSMVRTWHFFKVCMDASVGLHNGSFQGIMRAPMRFFEVNPLGRLVFCRFINGTTTASSA